MTTVCGFKRHGELVLAWDGQASRGTQKVLDFSLKSKSFAIVVE